MGGQCWDRCDHQRTEVGDNLKAGGTLAGTARPAAPWSLPPFPPDPSSARAFWRLPISLDLLRLRARAAAGAALAGMPDLAVTPADADDDAVVAAGGPGAGGFGLR